MIVCLCHAVSDKAVRAAIDRGARTAAEVGKACRAGTGCGACRETVRAMIDQHRRGCDSAAECHPGAVASPHVTGEAA